MSKLEDSIMKLAAAATEFDETCTQVYKFHKKSDSPFASGKAQIVLQDTVRNFCQQQIFSAGQTRAITGALSGWQPPHVRSGQSLSLTDLAGGEA